MRTKFISFLIPFVLVFTQTSLAKEHYADLVGFPKPVKIHASLTPAAPDINAKAFIMIDADSGKVLGAKNVDEQIPPASLTKLMTMYVISNALKTGRLHLDGKVTVSKKAAKMGGSKMFLKSGQEVTVENLIKGIIIDSGNDACVAMAQYIAGGEPAFASIMNQTAQSLGMTNTHFVDSTGLPSKNHYSSAKDMAILARAIIHDYPEYYSWYKDKWFKFNDIRQPNRNRLLWWDDTVDGLKTGHTRAAGYCLVASAKRHNMRLISVVMGAKSDKERALDSQKLINYGFRFYETHKVYAANQPVTRPRVWKGKTKYVDMGVTEDVYVTIPVGQFNELKADIKLPTMLKAPIVKGRQYGSVHVTFDGQPYRDIQLVALQDDPRGGIWRRMSDAVGGTVHKWFSSKKQEDTTA